MTTQIKKLEKIQKQVHELREDFNKLQSEAKEIIKRKEIYEIKKTAQDMKRNIIKTGKISK
jgi:hypothetical protein